MQGSNVNALSIGIVSNLPHEQFNA